MSSLDRLSASLAGMSAELSQAALHQASERAQLLARVHVLAKENQRHQELERMLMGRIKLLEHALWELRTKHGQETAPEPSETEAKESARSAQGRARQQGRKAALLKLLQKHGLEPVDAGAAAEAAALVARTQRPPKRAVAAKVPTQVEAPAAVSASPSAVAPSEASAESAAPLDALQLLAAQAGGLTLPADLNLGSQDETPTGDGEIEEERLVLGPEASRMMRRMHKSSMGGKKRKPGVGQLVAAALGSSEASASSSSSSSSSSSASSSSSSEVRKWAAGLTVRSHLDVVRGVAFHASRPLLATAGDDWSVRLHRLDARREPALVLRGHACPVLGLALDSEGGRLHSGGLDGSILSWRVPEEGEALCEGSLTAYSVGRTDEAHDDAVWSLSWANGRLLSAGADRQIGLWAWDDDRSDLRLVQKHLQPAPCVGAVWAGTHVLAGLAEGSLLASLIDAETGVSLTALSGNDNLAAAAGVTSAGANEAAVGHTDGHITLWDLRDPKQSTANFVAHPGNIARIDMTQSLVVTGSSDTVRLWDLRNRACMSDFVAHRKKFDEGVTALQFHPTRNEFASGGGDGVVKVFVEGGKL